MMKERTTNPDLLFPSKLKKFILSPLCYQYIDTILKYLDEVYYIETKKKRIALEARDLYSSSLLCPIRPLCFFGFHWVFFLKQKSFSSDDPSKRSGATQKGL